MSKLTVTLPDGTTATRETYHSYTHVVCVQDRKGWGALSWHGSRKLAEQKAGGVLTWKAFSEVQVLPVDGTATMIERHPEAFESITTQSEPPDDHAYERDERGPEYWRTNQTDAFVELHRNDDREG